jgi:hypothetical protein
LIEYRVFANAKIFVQGLKLKNHKEWRKYCRGELINRPPKPSDIPQNPDRVYKNDGWTAWGDFLETGNIASSRYKAREFEQARKFVRQLNFKNEAQWREYCKSGDKPDDIPANPEVSY